MREILLYHKKSLTVTVLLVAAMILFWQFFAMWIGKTIQNTLVQRVEQQLTGRLVVGDIDLTLSGRVRVRNIFLYDQQGNLLAKIPVMKMLYRWTDLTGGSLGLAQVENVMVQGSEIWLTEENGKFNWDGLLHNQPSGEQNFHSKIEFESGKFHLQSGQIVKTVEDVKGSLAFVNSPDMEINLQGKMAQSVVNVQGHWGKTPGELTLKIDAVELNDWSELFSSLPLSYVEGGKLENLTVVAGQDEQKALHVKAQGDFAGLNIAGKLNIRDGQGKFTGDASGIQFSEVAMLLYGQQAVGQGSIDFKDNKKALDMSFSLPDADPAALVTGLTAQRPLAVQIQVSGQLTEPEIKGAFSLPQVSFSGMAVDGVTGSFHYRDNQIALQDVNGTFQQGRLTAAGAVYVDNQSYELDVSGSNLESSRLTDKDVQGPLSFTGHVSGRGEEAITKGNFAIHNGKAYGITFQQLTGFFVKRGTAMELSDLAVRTAFGTFYPEQLSQEVLDRLKKNEMPAAEEELKRAVAEKLIKQIFR